MASAQQAGLAWVKVLHFHDVPAMPLFRDGRMSVPIQDRELSDLLAGSGLLVIGDGGAARMRMDPRRAAATAESLAWLRPASGRWAWLNPVPNSRWPGTTAEIIGETTGIPMFNLDRPGLARAMISLKGQKG